MVYTRSMTRRATGEAIREAATERPNEDAPTESDDSSYAPSESPGPSESVGSNSSSEDASVTLGSEPRSASSTETDLSGFIVRDDQTCIDEATSRSPPTHATAIARTERLEREVAAILAALRSRR